MWFQKPRFFQNVSQAGFAKYDYIGGNTYTNMYAQIGKAMRWRELNLQLFGFFQAGALSESPEKLNEEWKRSAGFGVGPNDSGVTTHLLISFVRLSVKHQIFEH